MARPRRYEERTSRHERKTLPDHSRGERRKRDDRSYDRADGSSRKGGHRGPNGRDSRRESRHQRSRRDSSSRGSRDEVFVVYEERRNSRGSRGQRRGGRGRGSAARTSTASGSSATSGGSQATGNLGSGEASHEWRPVYAVCEGPTPEWSGMSNEDKLEHLGEIAARDAAIKARDVLRYN